MSEEEEEDKDDERRKRSGSNIGVEGRGLQMKSQDEMNFTLCCGLLC